VNNNDVLRSVRYMLDLGDTRALEMFALGGVTLDKAQLNALSLKEDEAGFVDLPDADLSFFLDGLIAKRRGVREGAPAPERVERISNNLILKKLRIAFELREDDVISIFDAAGFSLSRPEVSALFRRPDQKNYRNCGDQVLRYFLKGLTLRVRGDA